MDKINKDPIGFWGLPTSYYGCVRLRRRPQTVFHNLCDCCWHLRVQLIVDINQQGNEALEQRENYIVYLTVPRKTTLKQFLDMVVREMHRTLTWHTPKSVLRSLGGEKAEVNTALLSDDKGVVYRSDEHKGQDGKKLSDFLPNLMNWCTVYVGMWLKPEVDVFDIEKLLEQIRPREPSVVQLDQLSTVSQWNETTKNVSLVGTIVSVEQSAGHQFLEYTFSDWTGNSFLIKARLSTEKGFENIARPNIGDHVQITGSLSSLKGKRYLMVTNIHILTWREFLRGCVISFILDHPGIPFGTLRTGFPEIDREDLRTTVDWLHAEGFIHRTFIHRTKKELNPEEQNIKEKVLKIFKKDGNREFTFASLCESFKGDVAKPKLKNVLLDLEDEGRISYFEHRGLTLKVSAGEIKQSKVVAASGASVEIRRSKPSSEEKSKQNEKRIEEAKQRNKDVKEVQRALRSKKESDIDDIMEFFRREQNPIAVSTVQAILDDMVAKGDVKKD